MLQNNVCNKRATWALGAFAQTDDYGAKKFNYGGEYNATGRLTALPVYKDDGKKLVHVGLGYSYRKPNENDDRDNDVSYDARPEAHLVGKMVGTGDIPTTGKVQLIGTELAAVCGQLSFQGEFNESIVDRISGMTPAHLYGYYLESGYFLTGEHKNYKRGSAKFGGIEPKKNFGDDDGGKGAWEVAARYSRIDLNDRDIVNQELKSGSRRGGVLSNVTVGLNWYLNPLTRVMMNYVYSDLQNIGIARILQTRVQVSF
jgi:phosphate-selective porin OprO/OprP